MAVTVLCSACWHTETMSLQSFIEPLIQILLTLSQMAWTVLGCYAVCMAVLSVYGLQRFVVVRRYHRYYKRPGCLDALPAARFTESALPRVTIQLPCYNEMYVIERLIDSVGAMDYPRDRFEVQVLDDSTDETTMIAQRKVDDWCAGGLDIVLLRRGDRRGYKAGALASGLSKAKGELIAIFDADFVPRPNFLRETVHYFTDPAVGLVQSRWTHLNRDYSILTQVQSIILDAHH